MVHASGFITYLGCIQYGARMVLLERFDPDAVLDTIETHRCTWMLGLPFMFHTMLERQRARPREVGCLRFCLSGGDVCPIPLGRGARVLSANRSPKLNLRKSELSDAKLRFAVRFPLHRGPFHAALTNCARACPSTG